MVKQTMENILCVNRLSQTLNEFSLCYKCEQSLVEQSTSEGLVGV